VGIGPVNLVLQEEEPKKGGGSTVHRPWRGSLELRKCWNRDKCVPIENIAIRATQPNGCSPQKMRLQGNRVWVGLWSFMSTKNNIIT